MANTADTLRIKSENLKNGIGQLLQGLVSTNLEIAQQIEMNEAAVAQANANIAQLGRDNEELAVLKADNETFIEKVEGILNA